MARNFLKISLSVGVLISFQAFSHADHAHGKPLTEAEVNAANGLFAATDVKDRALSDWEGMWQSVYPYAQDGSLDPVFHKKAAKARDKSFAGIKEYYRKGYATNIGEIGIENGVMEFHLGDKMSSCKYDYAGYKVLTYASGKKGVRYLFECKEKGTDAPKYVQFSDHIISPRKSAHFHIFSGNVSQQALLAEMDNWPTYYPYQLTREQVVDDMLHHE